MTKKKKWSLFDIVNTSLVILITLVILYPLYFVVIASFSNPTDVSLGKTFLWLSRPTLECYRMIMNEDLIWSGYRTSLIVTAIGTCFNLFLQIPTAYVISKKYLPFRGIITWYYFVTMFIGGGLVPTYFVYKNLDLINTIWALILGSGVSCYNLIITRQYFSTSIPGELFEAARIDGATEFEAFLKVAMPLAKPIIAVIALYEAVGFWNSWFSALIYVKDTSLYPLQLVMKYLVISNQLDLNELSTALNEEMVEEMLFKAHVSQTMKYGIVIVASLPMLMIYPFIQKHFVKGALIGSIKG